MKITNIVCLVAIALVSFFSALIEAGQGGFINPFVHSSYKNSGKYQKYMVCNTYNQNWKTFKRCYYPFGWKAGHTGK